jgi:gliding motility-associated-like protein
VASDDKNCVDTATDCGHVIDPNVYVPSAFSPNGDGLNDWFRPVSRNVEILDFCVYNRWGQRVHERYYDNSPGWDGNFRGKPCEIGTYLYFIRYKILDREPRLIKGDVTLVR